PVTNVPDTFIEEVADHAMMLILATYRRVITMDRMVREGRWAEGRPPLSQFPRLMGQTLGLIALGHVARAVAVRARAFGFHIKALKEGWIAAAGLDVLEQEPPDNGNPLLKMDNVILTPHVASASARFDPVRKRRVGQEIALVLSGRWPRSCVNPSVLEKSKLVRWQPYSMERGPGA